MLGIVRVLPLILSILLCGCHAVLSLDELDQEVVVDAPVPDASVDAAADPDTIAAVDAPLQDLAIPDSALDKALPDKMLPDLGPQPAGTTHVWSYRYGNNTQEAVNDVAVDSSSNIYVTGGFKGTVDFGGQVLTSVSKLRDIFVASYKPDGDLRWVKNYGLAANSQVGKALDVGAGTVYVTGDAEKGIDFGKGPEAGQGGTEAFLLALSQSSGGYVWSRLMGSSGHDKGEGVAADAAGNVFVTGQIWGDTSFGGSAIIKASTNNDIFVASYDKNGNYRWANRFGSAGKDEGRGVAVGTGAVYVTGFFDGVIDLGNGNRSNVKYNDIFIVALKPTGFGTPLWDRTVGSTWYDTGINVTVDGNNNVYATGEVQGPADFGGGKVGPTNGISDAFVASYDKNGAYRWSKVFGGAGSDGGKSIALDALGNVVIGGYYKGSFTIGTKSLASNQGSTDVLFASFTSAGGVRWAEGFGSPGADFCNGIAVDSASNLYAVGPFEQTVSFGGNPLTTSGQPPDIFLVKLGP
jgi:hypothetical protein